MIQDGNDDQGDPPNSEEFGAAQDNSSEEISSGRTAEAFTIFRKALIADLGRLVQSSRARALEAAALVRRRGMRFARGSWRSLRSTDFRGLLSAARHKAQAFRVDWRKRPARIRGVKQIAFIVVSLFVVSSAVLTGVAAWALHDVPFAEIAKGAKEPVVVLQAADGQALVQQGAYRGSYAAFDEFPDHLVHAVISIEDRRFFEHWGLDFKGIARASLYNLLAGEVVQGGSTITQQFLKIRYLERDRTLKRKIQEAFLSLWIETRMPKDELLASYLNDIYLGAGATGMPAAARIYFDKSVGELTLAESALLAGLIRAPSQLNPLENIKAAKERAIVVLNAMGDAGYLARAEINAGKVESMQLSPVRPDMGGGSWFVDWVMGDAREIAGPFRGSVEVRTTLVPELQVHAEQAVHEVLQTEGAAKGVTQVALVALRPDGAVVAMVGGSNYADSHFNRAVAAKRQPGSTFKLFVYYAALRAGFDLNDRIEDSPIEIDGWKPENYDGRYNGRVTVAEAFARSLNVATVRLAMEVGIGEVAAAARDLGIDADLNEMPSLALGASEVTLLDLTGAYASVRAGVTPIEPWAIASFSVDGGKQSFRIGPANRPTRELGEYHDPLVALLKLVVDKGTGATAALDGFAAGKTGTSQGSRDAWFIGFNEALTVGVWVGNDDGTPMDGVTGGQLPALIWKNFMLRSITPAVADVARSANDNRSGIRSIAELVAEDGADDSTPQCNVRACSQAYRSFRSSDCTFQPYRGSRKLCEK